MIKKHAVLAENVVIFWWSWKVYQSPKNSLLSSLGFVNRTFVNAGMITAWSSLQVNDIVVQQNENDSIICY